MALNLSFELDTGEGEYLVSLARRNIESTLSGRESPDLQKTTDKLMTLCGVFVTLNKVEGSSQRLKGCIGFPYPVKPLTEAVAEAAVSAALRDPRFDEVSIDEMDSIVVEVSVLTPPERIMVNSPIDYPEHVEIGVNGLIVSRGLNRGLLLPQVAVEWDWDSEEFLTQCCLKAGLPPDSWLMPETQISKFRAIIFKEEKPRGPIKRVELMGE
jgi:hypothetical protein